MKHPRACRQCRESKRRCVRRSHQVGEPCEPCQRRKLVCANSRTGAHSQSLLPKAEEPQPQEVIPESTASSEPSCPRVPTHVAVRLVDHYLEKLHNRPHSLFHPAKLRMQVRDGSVNQALLLAICSMASRFDDDEEIRLLENCLMDESKSKLLADLENICIENIQTCILIANLYAAHLKPSSEALFFRMPYPFHFLVTLLPSQFLHNCFGHDRSLSCRHRHQFITDSGLRCIPRRDQADRSRDQKTNLVDSLHG